MYEYLDMVKGLITKFQYFWICHILREDNIATDALARLVSSSKALPRPAFINYQFESSELDMEVTNVNCSSTE